MLFIDSLCRFCPLRHVGRWIAWGMDIRVCLASCLYCLRGVLWAGGQIKIGYGWAGLTFVVQVLVISSPLALGPPEQHES